MRSVRLIIYQIALLFLVGASARAEQDQELSVGVIISMSGGLEQWCGYMRQGMEIALGAASSEKVKVIFEDDASVDKKATLTAARKLLDIDRVDALYYWSLSTVPILAPLAAKARVPLIIGAYDNRIARAGDYVFGGFVNVELTSREIARFFKSRGAERIGIVLAADDWSNSFEAPFRDEAERLGLKVVYSETIAPQETETRTVITTLKKLKVDAVLAPLFGNSLLSFIRRHYELRLPSIINVADGMFEDDIKNLGVAAEKVTAMQLWVESLELKTKVAKKFGADLNPLQLGLVASGYDAMHHIIEAASALRKTGSAVTGETLNQKLKTFKSVGYLGETMIGQAPKISGEQVVVVENGTYRVPSEAGL